MNEYMEPEDDFRTIRGADGSIGITNVPVTLEATLTPYGKQVMQGIADSVIEATCADVVSSPCESCARCTKLQTQLNNVTLALDNYSVPDETLDTPDFRAYLADQCNRELNGVVEQLTAERDALQARIDEDKKGRAIDRLRHDWFGANGPEARDRVVEDWLREMGRVQP